MTEPWPISDDPKSVEDNAEFDQAVADCIVRLENGGKVDPDWLKANHPKWHRELAQFIADWDAVEGFSSEIRSVGVNALAAAVDIPDAIGEYKVLEQIGSGGMGVIYKAQQPSLSRAVAIKMLHNVRHDRRRFQMEAEAAARLDHPNIVSIFEVGEHEGNPYFTMPFIEGDDLGTIVRREKLAPQRAAEMAAKIADAVHYANQRGILHRDLKPGNILVDADDQPHVTDFGLAKRMEGTDQLTRTNAIIGTPSYMAPEQAMGNNNDVSVATDVYGVGAILYAMLTGKAPFSGSNSVEILRQVVDANPRGLDSTMVTKDLKVICEKCLDKSPANRYTSAGELADDLHRHLSGEPILARPLGKLNTAMRWVGRNPAVASLSVAAGLLLLFGLVSLSLLWRSESDARLAAEAGTRRERRLTAEVQNAFDRESKARRSAELTLSDAYANYGYAAQQQNRPNEAFLWFCHAEQVSPKQRVEANRRRMAAWMQRIPRPIFAHHDATFKIAKFDASSRWLLCLRRDQKAFHVFDLHSGDPVPNEFDGRPTSVKWGASAGILWFGTDEGAVYRLDCRSQNLERVAKVPSEVTCLGEATDSLSLAIGYANHIVFYDQSAKVLTDRAVEYASGVTDSQFCCDNQYLVVTCGNRHVYKTPSKASPDESAESPVGYDLDVEFDLRNRSGLAAERRQPFYPTVYDDDKLALIRTKSSDEEGVYTARLYVYDLHSNDRIQACGLGISLANSVPNPRGEVLNCGERYARIRTLDGTPHSERIVHGRFVTRCDMSPDANIIATADWRSVRLTERTHTRPLLHRNVNDTKAAFSVIPHQTRVSHVSFSGDSRLLVTVQFDGLTRVWDVAGALQPKVDFDVEQKGNRAEFATGHAQGARTRGVFTGIHHRNGNVNSFRELDLDTGEIRELVSDIDGQLRDVAYSADKSHFAMAVANTLRSGFVAIHEQAASPSIIGEATRRILLDADPRSLAAHPRKHEYAVLCGNGVMLAIDGGSGEIKGECRLPSRAISVAQYPAHNGQVTYSPDGSSLVLYGNMSASGVHVFDATSFARRFPAFKNNGILVQQCEISPNGAVVAVAGGRSNKVSLLDINTGEQVTSPIEHPSTVYSVKFSPDGSRIVTACRDGQARLIDWKTGLIVASALEHDGDVIAAEFANDGEMVVTISADKSAKLWDAQLGQLMCPPIFVGDGMRYLETDSASQRALVSGRVAKAVMIDLSQPPPLDVADTTHTYLLAELTAQARIANAGTVRLTADEWMERWNRYRSGQLFAQHSNRLFSGSPSHLTVSDDDR